MSEYRDVDPNCSEEEYRSAQAHNQRVWDAKMAKIMDLHYKELAEEMKMSTTRLVLKILGVIAAVVLVLVFLGFILGCAHAPAPKVVPPNTDTPKYDPRVVPENNGYEDGPRAGIKPWLSERRREKGW